MTVIRVVEKYKTRCSRCGRITSWDGRNDGHTIEEARKVLKLLQGKNPLLFCNSIKCKKETYHEVIKRKVIDPAYLK